MLLCPGCLRAGSLCAESLGHQSWSSNACHSCEAPGSPVLLWPLCDPSLPAGSGLQRPAAQGVPECHHALGNATPGCLQLPLAGPGSAREEREGVQVPRSWQAGKAGSLHPFTEGSFWGGSVCFILLFPSWGMRLCSFRGSRVCWVEQHTGLKSGFPAGHMCPCS